MNWVVCQNEWRLFANIDFKAIHKKLTPVLSHYPRTERLTITADDVIRDLIMIKENCMDKRHFDARGAIRALELIGKHLGMFTSKIQVEDNTEKKFIFCWQGEDDDERAN